jgi:hypothetical protein
MTSVRDASGADQPDKFDRLEFSKHLASSCMTMSVAKRAG